ncbi:hypothetical protein CQY20_21790 [Mycolicibacterium agri]|uniref:Uncharacterized protein n=1 Tax=Mycolicibacterium agri TaxID=36811 RepID=A0A2A7MVS6_MYCAG|nr:hypothetical protein [Mycolicibacterium agri]PEG35421.1 hypothetical protein CQY20_21790 [Mycolicibacterium agri]GFG55544.1 hypothetical protein MAGR_69850 [Mycolicibacterium agri]
MGIGNPQARKTSARIVVALAIIDFVLLLFPPLTWILGHGAVWYFLLTGAFGVLSLAVMYRLDSSAKEK